MKNLTKEELNKAKRTVIKTLKSEHPSFTWHVLSVEDGEHTYINEQLKHGIHVHGTKATESPIKSDILIVRASYFDSKGKEFAAIEMINAGMDYLEMFTRDLGKRFEKMKRDKENG